jgi:anthranilate synthase/aminodeoxychorismate synthase-like glutamine amidotransferase
VILVIDNYDSFTFNLVQRLGELGAEVRALRNDAVDVRGIRRLKPSHLVISPGPCTPNEAGVSVDAVRALAGEVPILGVCLGHQSIGVAFGGRVVRATRPVHGKPWKVRHRGRGIFRGLRSPIEAGRYHSLIVERRSLPRELEVTGWTAEGEIMALRHRRHRVEGVQFHPESILTPEGLHMLKNFLEGR